MECKETLRGFFLCEFKDYYGADCSLQRSSLIDPECIWFGVKPGCLDGNQWVPLPDGEANYTRMHLTRAQVRELLPYLQRFVDNGEFKNN